MLSHGTAYFVWGDVVVVVVVVVAVGSLAQVDAGRDYHWKSNLKSLRYENDEVVPNTNTHNPIVSNTIVSNTIVKFMLSLTIKFRMEKNWLKGWLKLGTRLQLWIEKRLTGKIPSRTFFDSAFPCEKRWLN